MDTKPDVAVHKTGDGSLEFEPSDDDPLHALGPERVIGASYTTGHQILPWGRDIT